MALRQKNNTVSALSVSQMKLLKAVPGVDKVLERLKQNKDLAVYPLSVLTAAVRATVAEFRESVLTQDSDVTADSLTPEKAAAKAADKARRAMMPNLDRVINATGVVIHTNLGRSLLSKKAAEHLVRVATGYSNLEFDLASGKRGIRYASVEDLLCELSGAEAAMAVNNNAGAVLLCLESLANGREVVVSRGELVEIGGSFRIPDVMKKSGATLREVGATNRTHVKDYEEAITDNTALLMKVHTSNYSMIGFTKEVTLEEMVILGKKHGLPVMNDLGSGTLVNFRDYGLAYEPTVGEAISAGADVVTFSGDKLLGGPQAGIILGKADILAAIKKSPLTRALRIDKLTLAALEMTLRDYRDKDKAITNIPTLNMMTAPMAKIIEKCEKLLALIKPVAADRLKAEIIDGVSRAGGGSFPLLEIPTKCVSVSVAGFSAGKLETALRVGQPPVIGRIEKDLFLMDLRTVAEEEIPLIRDALLSAINR